jgi:hypothetical protein
VFSLGPDQYSKKEIVELEYDENTTIQNLLDLAHHSNSDFFGYYILSGTLSFNHRFFPYIFDAMGKVIWNSNYDDTKVDDFLRTHEIKNNTIIAWADIPQASGRIIMDIFHLWNSIYPVLAQIATLLGLTFGIKKIVELAKSKFIRKGIPPQSVFGLILSKKQWNHIELSELLDLSIEDVKKLLQISGFQWDKSKMMYVAGKKIPKIIEKISKVNVYGE